MKTIKADLDYLLKNYPELFEDDISGPADFDYISETKITNDPDNRDREGKTLLEILAADPNVDVSDWFTNPERRISNGSVAKKKKAPKRKNKKKHKKY